MKKILFITDSHGNFKNILAMMKKEEPNIVFCGGTTAEMQQNLKVS